MSTIGLFDVLVVILLFALFILGFIQGSIRRLVGILSLTFSFFLAAQLHVPLGGFLAENWTQFPREYSMMLGFLTIFVAAAGAFFLVVQGTYQKAQLFARYPVVDEVIGGVLGVIQGLLLLLFVTVILDQYFLFRNLPVDQDEIGFLRDLWNAIDTSRTGELLHERLIPGFVSLTSLLLPGSVRALYGVG